MYGVLLRYLMTTGMPRYENYPTQVKNRITGLPMGRASPRSDSTTWDDLRALRKLWPHKLMVKGMLHPQDAAQAADCGADGVIVSNHGGRNLDSAITPVEVLPKILDAVGTRMTVIVDSGFRRGSDVVKALALGAHMVFIGRATLYGTGAGGRSWRNTRDYAVPGRDRSRHGVARLSLRDRFEPRPPRAAAEHAMKRNLRHVAVKKAFSS